MNVLKYMTEHRISFFTFVLGIFASLFGLIMWIIPDPSKLYEKSQITSNLLPPMEVMHNFHITKNKKKICNDLCPLDNGVDNLDIEDLYKNRVRCLAANCCLGEGHYLFHVQVLILNVGDKEDLLEKVEASLQGDSWIYMGLTLLGTSPQITPSLKEVDRTGGVRYFKKNEEIKLGLIFRSGASGINPLMLHDKKGQVSLHLQLHFKHFGAVPLSKKFSLRGDSLEEFSIPIELELR